MNLEIFYLVVLICLINSLGLLKIKAYKNLKLFCGIVGFSGIDECNMDKISMLMYYNSIERNSKHSTGIYNPQQGILKQSKDAKTFLKDNQDKIEPSTVVIAHMRAATVGSHSAENAHPFEFDNLIGVHNGTLKNHWEMCRTAGYSIADYNVDSQVLYKLLDDDSKEPEYNLRTLSMFEGAAALLFTDKRDPNTLYAYRNNERPLFCGKIDFDMYISSEADALKVIGCNEIKIFENNHLYTIRDGEIMSKEFYKEYVEPTPPSHQNTVGQSNINFNVVNKMDANRIVNNLGAYSNMNNSELVGKYLKCDLILPKYANVDISLTKSVMYLVVDYNQDNAFEIMIKDDKDKLVTVPKFFFCPRVEELKFTEYATFVTNIKYPEDWKGYENSLLFKKKEAYRISNLIIKDKPESIEIWSDLEKQGFTILKAWVVPSTEDEIKKKKEKLAADAIAEYEKNIQEIIDEDTPYDNQSQRDIINSKRNVNRTEPDWNIKGEAYIMVLNALSDAVDEIKEMASLTTWGDMKKKVDDLDVLITQAYDSNLMEQLAEEENKKLNR